LSFFENSIILTIMSEFNKFILYNISVEIFDCEKEILLLKNKLEEYNSIQLRKES
ncbi:hypothetical protein BDBG_17900, partial [Blastomyces gilchristii SLH14081]